MLALSQAARTHAVSLQALYRGAVRGKTIVACPIHASRIPKYQLLYEDDDDA